MNDDQVQETNVEDTESANADSNIVSDKVDLKANADDPNARLLRESRDNKERAKKAELKLKEYEESKLKEQNRWKDLYDAKQAEVEGFEGKIEAMGKKMVDDKVRSAVTESAIQENCVSIDDALQLGNRNLLQYDPDSDKIVGVDAFLEDLKAKKPFLFKDARSIVVNPAAPGGRVPEVKIDSLPHDEQMAALKAQLAANLKQ